MKGKGKRNMNKTVFEIKAHWEGDLDDIQYRYVVAETEAEAIEKFEAYNAQQVEKGFCRLIMIDYPIVEIDYVIG